MVALVIFRSFNMLTNKVISVNNDVPSSLSKMILIKEEINSLNQKIRNRTIEHLVQSQSNLDSNIDVVGKNMAKDVISRELYSELIERLKQSSGVFSSSIHDNLTLEKNEVKCFFEELAKKKNNLWLLDFHQFFTNQALQLRDYVEIMTYSFDIGDENEKILIETYLQDLVEILNNFYRYSDNLEAAFRHTFVNLNFFIQTALIEFNIKTKDFASAKACLIAAEEYCNIMNRLQNSNIKKNKNNEFNWVKKDFFEISRKIGERDNAKYIAKIFFGENNLKDAGKSCKKINEILEDFKKNGSNYVPIDIIDLFYNMAQKFEDNQQIEKAISFYQTTIRYCNQMLEKNIKTFGTDTIASDFSADHPDLQEKKLSCTKKLFDLARNFSGHFLEEIPAIEGIEIEISGFKLIINFNKISKKDNEKLFDIFATHNININADSLTNKQIIINPYFQLNVKLLKQIMTEFADYQRRIPAQDSSQLRSTEQKKEKQKTPSSYALIQNNINHQPSNKSNKKSKTKNHKNNNNKAINNEKLLSEKLQIRLSEEEKLQIRKTLNNNAEIYPIINDKTGTLLLTANWHKIKQERLASSMTQSTENKFKMLFSNGRIVGERGSGLKFVKGKYHAHGFFLKAKVGEDLELYAKKIPVTVKGRTFSVYEFDTLVDHKMQF